MAKQENRNTLSTSVLVRRFLPYFRKYRKTMAFDLCCAALTTVCELVLPLIVRTITTRATYIGLLNQSMAVTSRWAAASRFPMASTTVTVLLQQLQLKLLQFLILQ